MQTPISVAKTFAISAPDNLTVDAFIDDKHPCIPTLNPDFVFRKDYVRDVLGFLTQPFGDALYLTGPTGSGKTSLINQIAARLNYPVQAITCHGRLELNDLIGQFMLSNGTMTFVHGPLATALREGHVLLLNEIDLMAPSELAGLNDIIEGQPLVIAHNQGEMIRPHAHFRLIVTGNSVGQGDQSGLYQGVLQQNIAFMDRFRLLKVDYPDAAFEKALLVQTVQRLGITVDNVLERILDNMIKVADEVRKLFVGNLDGGGQLSVTLSTRTLIRWTHLLIMYKRAPNALAYALERALTFRTDPIQYEAIHRIAQDVFGSAWSNA